MSDFPKERLKKSNDHHTEGAIHSNNVSNAAKLIQSGEPEDDHYTVLSTDVDEKEVWRSVDTGANSDRNAKTSLQPGDKIENIANPKVAPKIKDESKDADNFALTELVTFNDFGEAFIDVNKLIYVPESRKKVPQEKQGSIYRVIPDYVFIFCNFISVLTSAFVILLGVTLVTWHSSLTSVTTDPLITILQVKTSLVPGQKTISLSKIGLVLIGMSVLNMVNTIMGIYGCVLGYKSLMILHVLIDLLFTIFECGISSILYSGEVCNEQHLDTFGDHIQKYMHQYTAEEPDLPEDKFSQQFDSLQLDNIQEALSCCGADGWEDYINANNTDFSAKEVVFPYSCCRPWWLRNIYCASGAHLWSGHKRIGKVDAKIKEKFKARINQQGCVPRVREFCKQITELTGPGFLKTVCLEFSLWFIKGIAAYIQVRNIQLLIRERIKLVNKEQKGGAGGGFDDDSYLSDSSSGSDLSASSLEDKKFKHRPPPVPPPTEDQIVLIKARSAFNKFEAKVKRTHIGHWMKVSRGVVRGKPIAADNQAAIVPAEADVKKDSEIPLK